MGLAAALLVAALAPIAVMSAPKGAPAVSDAQRKQGMAETPALVQAAGLPCQVSDARFVGKSPGDKKKGTPDQSYYEVACAPGTMGYILQASAGGPTTVFSCIEANTSPDPSKPPSLPCVLPGNSDPKAVLGPLLSKAGAQCTPTATRGIGQTKTQTFIEVACQEGAGYVAIASAPFDASKGLEAQNCLNFDDGAGNIKCALSDKTARLKIVDSLATAANNGCVVKDRRFVATAKDGADYYEASCQDGKGYIYKANGAKLAQATDCGHAQGFFGGCTLTDARQAETEQAALYTKLAKNSGSNCQVTRYALFPARPDNKEAVELVCADGNSAIGIFPATGKGDVLDCGHALVAGYKCSLGKADYSALTADLRKFEKSCTVSNARPAAKTQKGTILVEVACSDGLPGYMIEYSAAPVNALGATGCRFAGGCQLPGNKTS
ncbi:hypothetical protein DJ017_06580 [Phenylobacterium soli]|uniref:Uncharacterized protein n=1 Tax=Phenylobacterium soli TaxID=2170551 RepID=A0A328AHI0_9CAUL|nr:hypothetical protein DJ017_06580 [Phenylobacterium soli]